MITAGGYSEEPDLHLRFMRVGPIHAAGAPHFPNQAFSPLPEVGNPTRWALTQSISFRQPSDSGRDNGVMLAAAGLAVLSGISLAAAKAGEGSLAR